MLGVGGTVTLAAWTDSESAAGSFEASVFRIESSTGGEWREHAAEEPATLEFEAGSMSPGVSHFARMGARTTADSTTSGVVTVASVSHDGGALVPALEYRVTIADTCTAAAFEKTDAAAPAYAGIEATLPSPEVDISSAGADTAWFCFDVRITPDASPAFQGTTALLRWTLGAVST